MSFPRARFLSVPIIEPESLVDRFSDAGCMSDTCPTISDIRTDEQCDTRVQAPQPLTKSGVESRSVGLSAEGSSDEPVDTSSPTSGVVAALRRQRSALLCCTAYDFMVVSAHLLPFSVHDTTPE
jgi:hypothetical protein